MKNLFLLTAFFFSIATFASTKTGFYSANQTRAQVLENVKTYEKDLFEYKYSLVSQKIANKHDYTQTWSYESNGSVSFATSRYQFLEDRVLVTMTNTYMVKKDGSKIIVEENDSRDIYKKLYESLEDIYVNVYFKYLKVYQKDDENKTAASHQKNLLFDFRTTKYFAIENKVAEKWFLRNYWTRI